MRMIGARCDVLAALQQARKSAGCPLSLSQDGSTRF
jgi:hypothetical protein